MSEVMNVGVMNVGQSFMYIDNQNVDKYKHKLQFQRGTDWSPDDTGQACSLAATNLEAIAVSLLLFFVIIVCHYILLLS